MKKLILAATVAAVLAPAAVIADSKVYGNFRGSVISSEQGGVNDKTETQFVNNASRVGVKGEYGTEGGLTGFYNLQLGADNDGTTTSGTTTRFFFAGVKGNFGKVMAGRFSSPYKMAGLKTDPFYDTSAGSANGGSNHGYSNLTNGWLSNGVAYISPKIMGAITLNAAIFLDDDDNASNGALNAGEDPLVIGATYSAGGISASVQHFMDADGVDGDATRVTAAFKTGPFGIAASYEDHDTDAEFIAISGTYQMSDNTKFAIAYGDVEDASANQGAVTAGFNTNGESITAGVFQKIAPKTTITLIYSDVDANTDFVGDTSTDRKTIALGIIQTF